MFKSPWEIVFWIFAVYGFFMFILEMMGNFIRKYRGKKYNIEIVLTINDAEVHVEEVLRDLILRNKVTGGKLFERIRVIDTSGNKETCDIVEKLSEQFPYIILQNDIVPQTIPAEKLQQQT